ncbi:MAG: hypothetical protein M3355_03590 [Actinomycetota bacterium]|nr:hypothetical protein [Actinomycetota bacterium]
MLGKKMGLARARMFGLVVAFGIAVAMVSVAVAATTVTKTFSTGTVSRGVPDNSGVVQKLKIKRAGKIKDLNVSVALDTFENDDFDFALLSPKGKVVGLSTGNGASGNGYGNGCGDVLTFDDEATNNVADFEGIDHKFGGESLQPESYDDGNQTGGLQTLDNTQLRGTWKLVVLDNEQFGFGALRCFKVQAKFRPAG